MQVVNAVVQMKGLQILDVNRPWGGPDLNRLSLWNDWRPKADAPRDYRVFGAMLLCVLPVEIAAINDAALTLNCDYATFEVPNGIPGSDAMFTTYGVRIVPTRSIMVSVSHNHGHRIDRISMTSERVVLDVAGKVHAEIYLAPALELGAITPPPAVLAKLTPAHA